MRQYKSNKKEYSRWFTTDPHGSAYYSLIPNVGYRYFKVVKLLSSQVK